MPPVQIGQQIRQLRETLGLPLRKVAAALDIDQSALSKIEREELRATKEEIRHIARIFEADERELHLSYLSDQVLYQLEDMGFEKDLGHSPPPYSPPTTHK